MQKEDQCSAECGRQESEGIQKFIQTISWTDDWAQLCATWTVKWDKEKKNKNKSVNVGMYEHSLLECEY